MMGDRFFRLLSVCLILLCVVLPASAQHVRHGGGDTQRQDDGAIIRTMAPAPAPSMQPYDARGRPNPDAFDWTGVAIGASFGSLGVGAEGTFYLLDWLNFRVTANYLSLVYKTTIDRIDYDLDLSSLGALFLLDIYPGARRNVRITMGLTVKDTEVDILGEPRGNLNLGDQTFTPAQLGRLRGKAEYDIVAPYVGIGFGNAVRPDALMTFFMDVGVFFQGYDLTLNAEGSDLGGVENLLKPDIEDRLDWLKIYPVVTAGISYHF